MLFGLWSFLCNCYKSLKEVKLILYQGVDSNADLRSAQEETRLHRTLMTDDSNTISISYRRGGRCTGTSPLLQEFYFIYCIFIISVHGSKGCKTATNNPCYVKITTTNNPCYVKITTTKNPCYVKITMQIS